MVKWSAQIVKPNQTLNIRHVSKDMDGQNHTIDIGTLYNAYPTLLEMIDDDGEYNIIDSYTICLNFAKHVWESSPKFVNIKGKKLVPGRVTQT